MDSIEEAIIKVYLLQRERLREDALLMLDRVPGGKVPSTWVVPMDVPAIDKLVGSPKPYLYFDRRKMRFTHIVHAFATDVRTEQEQFFSVQRVITIPLTAG